MRNQMHNIQWKNVLLGLVFVLAVSITAQANEDGYALLVQASPPDGGTVTPGVGVFRTQSEETVMLSAKPKKGYRFVYWLGDVSSTSGVDTTVITNSPKLVVAVFAREDFDEDLPTHINETGAPIGGGGGRFINPIQSPGAVSPIGAVFDFPDFTPFEPPEPPDEPGDDDIPVPGDGDDDIPVPGDNEIPEPATILLLSMGATLLLRKRK